MTEKWARIIRFVELGALPPSIIAQYDADKNIVRIDRELFKRLNTYEQGRVMFTEEDIKYIPE